MENLDLNSQQEEFPYIDEYSALLDRGRGRAEGGRLGSFQPPRQSASGVPIGRGRSATRGCGRARGRSVSASHSPPVGAIPPLRPPVRERLSQFSGCRRGTSNSGATNFPSFMNTVDEEEMDEEDVDSFPSYDKANWSAENTSIFCELSVEQMRLGNCPGGKMNSRGYKEIARKFKERINLNHAPKQFRNRWTTCKKLYEFHKFAMSQSGLGRKANGAILADEEWWKTNIKSSECMIFSRYMPHYIDDLQEMYQKVVVDGSSSTVAGDVPEEAIDLDLIAVARGVVAQKIQHLGLLHTVKADSSEDSNSIRVKMELKLKQREMEMEYRRKEKEMEMQERWKIQEREDYEIDQCINMARDLFATRYNRTIFFKINTNESRLTWLKMKCIRNK
ncbi:hypothetical protein SETIT_3G259900v2 [Setaria italica]|uniref:Myb/SANT-like domain-containing protein n=1 Tax=Setaria italica TaxID=4555 RepID=A0A368QIZ4_SETIT|nr:hypothetical protein SETIT_3G259900v2 [Setaria italica]